MDCISVRFGEEVNFEITNSWLDFRGGFLKTRSTATLIICPIYSKTTCRFEDMMCMKCINKLLSSPYGGHYAIPRSVRLSVRMSVPWRSCPKRTAALGYRHAGCLQLSHVRTADPSADERRSAASQTAVGGGISSRRPRGDNLCNYCYIFLLSV